MLTEFHTTDLTDACMKRVELRVMGKRAATMTTALYRGQLFHEAAGLYHAEMRDGPAVEIVTRAEKIVSAKAKDEDRAMTETVARDVQAIRAEVAGLLVAYIERSGPLLQGSRVIGVEVPVRWTVNVDGEPAEFASHTDFVYRSKDGHLCVWDWKTGEESPTWEYLTRNLQMGMYYMAIQHGSVMLGDEWVEMAEPPMLTWVHVNNLAPYGRKTQGKDDDGVVREFVKGEPRPMRSIFRSVEINNEAAVLDAFSVRVRMARAGLYPANPDPIGCHLCESQAWCPNFHGDEQ